MIAGSSSTGGMIITFASRADWVTDDPRGILPFGISRDVLIRSSVGEALPVGLEMSAIDNPLPVIVWQGLRLIRKGREAGYNFWNDHSSLSFDLVVILTSDHKSLGMRSGLAFLAEFIRRLPSHVAVLQNLAGLVDSTVNSSVVVQ